MRHVEALLATIDAAASGFTLCRIAPGVQLTGTTFSGVSVLQLLKGTMRLDLPDGGSRIVKAGQMVLIPGGIRPVMACEGTPVARSIDGRQCLVRRDGWLIADAARNQPAELIVAAARLAGTTERSLREVLIVSLAKLPEGRGALSMLRAEINRSTAGSSTLAVTLMSACIVIALRIALANGGQGSTPRTADRRASIERALAAVRARPADPHDIDTLAQAAGMSRSTLTRYFRDPLGTTPGAFIQRARLNEAAALLRSTDLPIKIVAATAGFSNRSHFSTAFAGAFGCDPTTYRTRSVAALPD